MLQDMKDEYGLTLLFISHDLSVVKNVSDRVAVMYLGKICEIGDGDVIYDNPAHPYTRLLLAAIPDPENKHRQNAKSHFKPAARYCCLGVSCVRRRSCALATKPSRSSAGAGRLLNFDDKSAALPADAIRYSRTTNERR